MSQIATMRVAAIENNTNKDCTSNNNEDDEDDEDDDEDGQAETGKEEEDDDTSEAATIRLRSSPGRVSLNHGVQKRDVILKESEILSAIQLQQDHNSISFEDVELGNDEPPKSNDQRLNICQQDQSEMFTPTASSASFKYCQQQRQPNNHFAPHHSPRDCNKHNPTLGQGPPNMIGFAQCHETKLSFASKRMRDYFESFVAQKNRQQNSSQSTSMYQFFKSTRTELVACLLMSFIVSHATITCRTSYATNNQWMQSNIQCHLISGLVCAFTVATLTQIFGHVSGSHLLPAVSWSLYLKGHISRFRLLSYLCAQTLGVLLGIGLLAALTSSQVELQAQPHRPAAVVQSSPQFRNNFPTTLVLDDRLTKFESSAQKQTANNIVRLRRKRGIKTEQQQAARASNLEQQASTIDKDDEPTNLNEIQGSETILLSIMEQQHREQSEKTLRHLEQQEQSSKSPPAAPITSNVKSRQPSPLPVPSEFHTKPSDQAKIPSHFSTEKTISVRETILEHETITKAAPVMAKHETYESEQSSPKLKLVPLRPEIMLLPPPRYDSSSSNAGTLNTDHSRPFRGTSLITKSLNPANTKTISWTHAHLNSSDLPDYSWASVITTSTESPDQASPPPPPKKITKLMRKKRTKANGQQQHDLAFPNATSLLVPDSPPSYSIDRTINLLRFALPDMIMSSDSGAKCLREVRGNNTNDELANSFKCLSLSNGSQMFIFQLLATVLIVLTYLINVDPRRSDLGFKSLSIGLAYFLAHMLSSQAAGFYGNPIRVLALYWFASGDEYNLIGGESARIEWRSEWFLFFVTPLISGLFGALSHEYIDFSSFKSQNQRLHLRRSFYSLDDLSTTQQRSKGSSKKDEISSERLGPSNRASSSSSAGESCVIVQDDESNENQRSKRTIHGSPSVHSSHASSLNSIIGARSSIVTLDEQVTSHSPRLQQIQSLTNSMTTMQHAYNGQMKLEQAKQASRQPRSSAHLSMKHHKQGPTRHSSVSSSSNDRYLLASEDSNFLIGNGASGSNAMTDTGACLKQQSCQQSLKQHLPASRASSRAAAQQSLSQFCTSQFM